MRPLAIAKPRGELSAECQRVEMGGTNQTTVVLLPGNYQPVADGALRLVGMDGPGGPLARERR